MKIEVKYVPTSYKGVWAHPLENVRRCYFWDFIVGWDWV